MSKCFLFAVFFSWFGSVIAAESALRLKATYPKSSLRSRDIAQDLVLSPVELFYVDENSISASLPLAARLAYTPKFPTLLLDDHSPQFSHVHCTESKIILEFRTSNAMEAACSSWTSNSNFTVITAEFCQVDNQIHKIYQASGATQVGRKLEILVTETTLKESADNIQMSFGNHIYEDYLDVQLVQEKMGQILEKRNAESTLSLPFPPSTTLSGPSLTSVSQSIATSFVDTNILPPSGEIAQFVASAFVPDGFNLRCMECSTTGSLEVTDGEFDFNMDKETDIQGYINLFAKDVTAHVDLELKLGSRFNTSLVAPLPPIPIPYLAIPGIENAEIGMFLIFEIVTGIQLNAPLDISTGFKVKIPAGSQIHIDLGNPDRSYSRGFADAEISALPFNTHGKPISFNFFAGLQPHLQLQVAAEERFVGSAAAEMGIFLDSPKIQLGVEEVSGVNDKCEPTTKHPVDHALIKVVPTAIIDQGFDAGFDVSLDVDPNVVNIATSVIIASTAYPLPTACFDFDSNSNSLVSANSGAIRALGGVTGCHELLSGALIVTISASILVWL